MRIVDALYFIKDNNVLSTWSDEQIVSGILRAIKTSGLTFTVDSSGNLDSIAFGKWVNKTHFHCIAMAGKGKVRTLLRYLQEVFPSCTTISFERRGVFKIHNLT